MNPGGDLLISTLAAAKRNRKLNGQFNLVLARSRLSTLVKSDGQTYIVVMEIEGAKQKCLVCFSNQTIAGRTLRYFLSLAGNEGRKAYIKPMPALRLFFSAAINGLPIYLNPKSPPGEQVFFSPAAVKEYLLGPWALDYYGRQDKSASGEKVLSRTRQGRKTTAPETALTPISEVDFDRPLTAGQIAEIFGISENQAVRSLTELDEKGVIDLQSVSITLPIKGTKREARYFEPYVAFHLGYQLPGLRGDEFRKWHAEMLFSFCIERANAETENAGLKNQLEMTHDALSALEAESSEKERVIEALKAENALKDETIRRLNQELSNKNKYIAELNNDLKNSESWNCPESVEEATRLAEAKFSSRLIIHERVYQGLKDFNLNNDLRAVHEIVKMFTALAGCLYDLKFRRDGFSEEQFRDETGLTLSMTESKASKKEKAVEDSRTCFFNGRKILFYPHLKKNVLGVQIRLYFQFLDDEKKIIVCHVGNHLPNARTKYL
ncbi:MAG: ELKS/Rab6-interacting/CAST family protein [Candidatus Adiutrix sp.]|jgi:Mn-dependent DtxR family transcriptional regulator|nr:ELKS/Rab6-interacting/CAST family protein [Candidatus Adiutrix sp.]